MTYSEKLKDPRWQKKRLEILKQDNFQCQYCGDKESTLHVHHLIYRKNTEPWEYEYSDLVTVCEYCHKFEHLKHSDKIIDFTKSIFSFNVIACVNLSKLKKSDLIKLLELHNRGFIKEKREFIKLLDSNG